MPRVQIQLTFKHGYTFTSTHTLSFKNHSQVLAGLGLETNAKGSLWG